MMFKKYLGPYGVEAAETTAVHRAWNYCPPSFLLLCDVLAQISPDFQVKITNFKTATK